MTQEKTLWHLSISGDAHTAPILAALVEPFLESVSWHEHHPPRWCVEGFYTGTQEALEKAVTASIGHLKSCPFTIVQMPFKNWLQESFNALPPFSVGCFYIYGSHHTKPLLSHNQIGLHIDAATAFGSGHHETTRGCLLALESLSPNWRCALDLGCGSGILALALAALGKKFPTPPTVVACDYDQEALRVTQQNSKTNNLSVHTQQSLGFEKLQGFYDCIVANITADVLIQLKNDVDQHMLNQGHLVLSGILCHQVRDVVAHYQGFILKDQYTFKEWVTLVLQKTVE